MKYVLILLLGVVIGIGGEFLIPNKYVSVWGGGCIKRTSDGLVYMPQLLIYNPNIKDDPDPYPALFGGGPMTFVYSYEYMYYFLSKQLTYLSQDDCNALVQKFIDSRGKK